MPWRNTSMFEQRKNFILAVQNPRRLTFSQLCQEYNISTKTGYKWLHRYQKNGEKGLTDLPRIPIHQPTKISLDVENCIISIRQEFKTWGPKKIRAEIIHNFGFLQPPSEASIGKILIKHQLSKPRILRRHVAQTAPLAECNAPNNVWMYDFKGWFITGNGSKCEPLTITDGYSRFLLACQHMHRKRTNDVWSVLEEVFCEYGLPDRLRSDNGPPFASLAVGRLSPLAIKLVKIGVVPEWIEPGCPQQNGRHERFHLTLKKETAMPSALTLNLQQEKFDQFQVYYNERRPHEALHQVTPSSIYVPSQRTWDRKFRSPEYSQEYEPRKVGRSGNISWRGSEFFLSEMLEGEYIGIKELDFGLMGIYYGPIFLGTIDLNKGFKRI